MSRRKVKGQNTAKIKDYTWGQKILWVGIGLFSSFLLSLSLFELHYKNMQCSRDRSVWVGWGIHSFCLFACFLPPSRDLLWLLRYVFVHFEPVLACKKYIQRGETCWVRQEYRKRQSWNSRWFTHYGISQDHFSIFLPTSKFCIQTLWTSDSDWRSETLTSSPYWLKGQGGGEKKSYSNQIGLRKVKQRTVFQSF